MDLNLMVLFRKGSPDCLCWVRLARVFCQGSRNRFDPHAVSNQETENYGKDFIYRKRDGAGNRNRDTNCKNSGEIRQEGGETKKLYTGET
ncbi:hypothetical protein AMECASPLE_029151 [Ameca splendens]|uniref:Uncharacterized protein n=1 Tax=Ameca splendens TaxID=208324 RepID=A0ABV0ZEH4_9TELE